MLVAGDNPGLVGQAGDPLWPQHRRELAHA
jgi:hypothetical protein